MQLPLTDPETLFEELLQDLPPETAHMAREFKAFVRAKKVKTVLIMASATAAADVPGRST